MDSNRKWGFTNVPLARQTDGTAVQLPPKPSGHPSALARQEKIGIMEESFMKVMDMLGEEVLTVRGV